jgi:hypothetical protein
MGHQFLRETYYLLSFIDIKMGIEDPSNIYHAYELTKLEGINIDISIFRKAIEQYQDNFSKDTIVEIERSMLSNNLDKPKLYTMV